jgi:hypothetical protein
VRVNIEDSIKKHLPRLASEMGWSANEALGQLVRLYGATQAAGVHEETSDRILTVCALEFASDDVGERFLTAMIKAQLAVVLDDGRIRIRGNGEHVQRAIVYKNRASNGGKASAKARNRNLNDSVTTSTPASALDAQPPSQPSFTPLLLSSKDEETTKRDLDLPAEVPKTKRRKSSPGAAPSGVTVPIRVAWFREYEKKYGQAAAWGRKENGQCAQLLGTFSATELVELVPFFFAWKRPEVIRAGHSFGKGANSFVMKIDELRADIADSERRKLAAQAEEAEKQGNRAVAGISQAERVAARFGGASGIAGDGNRRIDQGAPPGPGAETGPDGGDAREDAVG